MATRKRRHTRRRRHVAANPVARRRHTTRRRRSASLRTRHHNPLFRRTRKRSTRRRRNPIARGVVGQAANFAFASIGVGFFKPIVTKFVGGLLPFGTWNGPILTAGTGFLTGKLFELVPVSFIKKLAEPAMIVGFSAAIIEAISPYIRGFVGAAQSPLLSAPHRSQGRMRGIGITTGIPPRVVPLPAPAANAGSGMNGLGMRSGVYGR